jgi:hypothetical protein
MESYWVWGDVLIRTRDSMVVRTEKLKWFKKTRKIESDTYVQIETNKGDILKGKGLDATEDFSHFSFKEDVTGAFPDFKRRMENKEESISESRSVKWNLKTKDFAFLKSFMESTPLWCCFFG